MKMRYFSHIFSKFINAKILHENSMNRLAKLKFEGIITVSLPCSSHFKFKPKGIA